MELVTYRYWRRRAALFWPTSVIGKLALYFTGVWAVLAGIRYFGWWIAGTDKLAGLGPLIGLARAGSVLFFTILILRWVRNRFLWKLRNRLIVTYFFIGVVPLGLVITIGLLSAALFLNQFATSEATHILDGEVRAIAAVGENLAQEIAHRPHGELSQLQETHNLGNRYPGFELAAWKNGKSLSSSTIPYPQWSQTASSGVIKDGEKIYLRAISHIQVKADTFVVVTSVPVSRALLDRSTLGEITMFIPREKSSGGKNGFQVSLRDDQDKRDVDYDIQSYVTGGSVPPSTKWWDRAWMSTTLITYRNWTNGKDIPGGVRVNTRSSVLITALFSHQGQFAAIALIILGATALFFALIVLTAVIIGVRLTRTITFAVYRLYQATQRINRGELHHRIEVKTNDQLAALQKSFNSMSDSLEQLIAEQKIKQRLENELAIAQEVQETLFPRQDIHLDTLELYGICKPARTVSGDYYDFLPGPEGAEQLTLAVGDISGKGISAALLMATVHSAVRAYQYGQMPAIESIGHAAMAGVAHAKSETARGVLAPSEIQSPADVLELLNRHLFQSTQPEKYATMFLSVWDGPSRSLTYSNAGHLPPIILSPDGLVRRLEEGGMVIGLFDEMVYDERTVEIKTNEIFVAFSDGVTEPENEFGEFGEQRLIELIIENRRLPLARIADAVIAAVQDWIGAEEQPDDITIVLARAR
jgi:phosphoserine phosphatase RsbU/P